MKDGDRYYRMTDKYKGHHYFKANSITMDNVTKITVGTQPKKGRPFCIGISLIRYTSFIGNYGWRMDDPNYNTNIKEITKQEYDKAFELVLKKLK